MGSSKFARKKHTLSGQLAKIDAGKTSWYFLSSIWNTTEEADWRRQFPKMLKKNYEDVRKG